jgi:hypothetical protein
MGRAATVVRGVVDLLLAARAETVGTGFNPRGRHFQMAFADCFDRVYSAMVAEGMSEEQLHRVFQRLAGRFAGWEDKLETALRGVPDRDLARVPNPFLPSPPGW